MLMCLHRGILGDMNPHQAEALKNADSAARRLEQRACAHCTNSPTFDSGYLRDCHLLSHHHYDLCRLCRLIGPPIQVHLVTCSFKHAHKRVTQPHFKDDVLALMPFSQVMVHTASQHPAQLCHLCGAYSPLFVSRSHVVAHLRNCHVVESPFSCPNCANQPFSDIHTWLAHLKKVHKWSNNESLRPMKRKRAGKPSCKEEVMGEVNPICGLINASHRHCHLLSVLHLLAQAGLPALPSDPPQSPNLQLQNPLHHLSQFFDQYSKGSSFFPHHIIQNPSSFGVDQFPDRPADLIRLFVKFFSQSGCSVAFKTMLEWRFECHMCKRFTRTRMQDTLLRINATEAASFEEMLDKFLTKRRCICGALCTSEPSTTSTGGDFLFIDLDRTSSKRSLSCPAGEEEVSLFPLRLLRRYNILGISYKVFATINLNLDYAEGGHYSTNVFLGEEDGLICVHEEDVDLQPASPSFDSTAILVALRKEADEEVRDDKDGSVEVSEGSSLPSPSPVFNIGQGDPFPCFGLSSRLR